MSSITGNSYLDSVSNVAKDTVQPKEAKKAQTLGQESFLKLMTTQLKTQDPFAPVDNQQMIAQMAQFSSVAGIAEMNTSLKAIADDIKSSRMGDASSWIGRSALIESETATALKDGSYAGSIALAKDAASVDLQLIDAQGAVVHGESFGKSSAGTLTFNWDGKGADGKPVAGPLKMIVSAIQKDGGPVEAATAAWTGVTGVQSPAGGSAAKLVTALGLVTPADALSLS